MSDGLDLKPFALLEELTGEEREFLAEECELLEIAPGRAISATDGRELGGGGVERETRRRRAVWALRAGPRL